MSSPEKKRKDHAYYLKNKKKIIKGSTEWNKKNRAYHRQYDKKWREKYPHKRRESYLKRTYKMPLAEYNLIRTIQENRCAICLEKSERLVVDHDHKTNNVRSLLCTTCNAGLGQFKDNIELLAKAIAYLTRYETSQSSTNNCP